jgi:Gametolysin peptidase M11
LGLHHAFQSGLEYGDVTGYMGGAVRATNYPRRCYNAQNHWHVGWYSSRSIEIDPYSTSSAVYRVIPFVDFNKANTGEYAIVKLTGLDLYMQYNRQKSFNVETGELQDRLTIVRDTGEGTDLLAGLSDDSPWWQRMYDSRLLTIEVCSVQMARSSQEPDVMFVSIGFGASRCPQSNAPSSGSTSTQSSPTNRMVDSMIFPIAMVSVLVVVLVSLTAVFIRASRGKASAVASDDGDKMVESDRVTDIDNTSHSMADDSADLEQSRSPLDPYGDLASPCLWNWANWRGNCGDFGR